MYIVTFEEADLWCKWNAKKIDLLPLEEKIYRREGKRLWRKRFLAGLDPATGIIRTINHRIDSVDVPTST
jgi:hypothetical protein